MSESIVVFHTNHRENAVIKNRREFYENRWTKYSDYFVYLIDVLLFNSKGKILLQKRAKSKKNSPGEYHTSVGGHINEYDSPYFTLLHECIEELGTNCYLPINETFDHVFQKIGKYTNRIAIIKEYKDYFRDLNNYKDPAKRIISCKDRVFLCFGIYDGPIHCLDESSDGFEYYSIKELKIELKKHPQQFTSILHNLIENIGSDLELFCNKYCNTN